MTQPTDDLRLDELLSRYWDNTLSAEEMVELNAQLLANPEARHRLRFLSLLARVSCDHARRHPSRQQTARRRSRHRRLALVGCVAVLLIASLGLYFFKKTNNSAETTSAFTLLQCIGEVQVGSNNIVQPTQTGQVINFGQTVATIGLDSSAVLRCEHGPSLSLMGETEAKIRDEVAGRHLSLNRGGFLAKVHLGQPAFVVTTAEAHLRTTSEECQFTAYRTLDHTEISVISGRVQVSTNDGQSVLQLSHGEIALVEANGMVLKQLATAAPEQYAWDLSRPLPADWRQGQVITEPSAQPYGRAVVPLLMDDPYLRRTCWQIRSENRWTTGLFAFHPDTHLRIRYRVDRTGEGQLLAVIRPDPPRPEACQVLLAPISFTATPPGVWQTVILRTNDWQVEHSPKRGPLDYPQPWIAFLVVFNTYEQNLGLKVSEFAVRRGPFPTSASN